MIGRHNLLFEVTPVGWMLNEFDQGNINRTREFVVCLSDDFDVAAWNEVHGAACRGASCDPSPPHAPHDIDCSWLRDADTTPGATGAADNVGAKMMTQYITAFYFALVTLSTVGYGDMSPSTPLEMQFVVLSIVVGAFMYAYIIGEFSDLISNMKAEQTSFEAHMRSVNDLLAYIDAPISTRDKVVDFFEYKFDNRSGIDVGIVEQLPTALQRELVLQR